jgi:predicted GH43/DUF377 family glycosyl hydrolase
MIACKLMTGYKRPLKKSLVVFLALAFIATCAKKSEGPLRPPIPDASDKTPPSIIYTYPMNGEKWVGIDSTINAGFNEEIFDHLAINPTNFMVLKPDGSKLEAKTYYNHFTSVASLIPVKSLDYNAQYTVLITKDIQDVNGNKLVDDFRWVFTTVAEPKLGQFTVNAPKQVVDDTGFDLTIIAQRTDGSVLETYTGTPSLASSNGDIANLTELVFTNGKATISVTLNREGTSKIRVADGLVSKNSEDIQVVTGKFSKFPNMPVLSPGGYFDKNIVQLSQVISDDHAPVLCLPDGSNKFTCDPNEFKYRMYYTGYNNWRWSINSATSYDGITWFRRENYMPIMSGGSGLNAGEVMAPFVMKDEGIYKMWYTGYDSNQRPNIIYATSADGNEWTVTDAVIPQGVASCVLKENGKYKAWYSFFNGQSIPVIHYAESDDGIQWNIYSKNPILSPHGNGNGASNSFYSHGMHTPRVMKVDGKYIMLFSGYDGTYWRIGYAESPDGIIWIKAKEPVFELSGNDWDKIYILCPSLLKEGTTYKMWYTGFDGDVFRIGYAESLNAVNWSRPIGIPVKKYADSTSTEQTNVPGTSPSVMQDLNFPHEATDEVEPAYTYRMWYSVVEGGVWVIKHLRSGNQWLWTPDDTRFKAFAPVAQNTSAFDCKGAREPSVIVDDTGGRYKMWYAGANSNQLDTWRIGLAKTDNPAKTWTRSDTPVLIPTQGSWDSKSIGTPRVLKASGTYMMWYTGTDDSGTTAIGLATSTDGENWTKYQQNPVITRGDAGSWEADGTSAPAVLLDGTIYRMWYAGYSNSLKKIQIGYATSLDGKTWTKSAGNPAMSGTTGGWDQDVMSSPSVFKEDHSLNMWYQGADMWQDSGEYNFEIGFAMKPLKLALPPPYPTPKPVSTEKKSIFTSSALQDIAGCSQSRMPVKSGPANMAIILVPFFVFRFLKRKSG